MANQILEILLMALQILTYALLGRALLSWVDPRQQWAISRMLASVTDPVIAPLRRVIPPIGMIDISFIVAILLIQVLQRLLIQAMYA
jgi:YggT family protein